MAVYLVDFENVTSAGISGIQRLTKEDKVYIFYTVNASNMSFAAHINLLSSPAEVIYYNVTSGGKNALDFQLSSFLGYLVSKGEDKEFYIISNDKGYEHVKSFWEKNGIVNNVKINSAPSINRSLLPMEKPFTAKIQQQPAPAQEVFFNSETLGQLKAEADRYNAQKAAAADEKATADEKTAEAPAEIKAEEEKPAPKKRGRPKKQSAEANAKAAEKPAAEAPADTPEASPASTSPANTSPASAAPAKARSKEAAMKSLRNAVKPLLEKSGIKSEGDVINISNLIKSADGKQQFYCKLTKAYGMEKGLQAYKALRSEYVNLARLVK